MATNDNSMWHEELINDLDNFDDKQISEIQELYDDCISDDEEVSKMILFDDARSFLYYRPYNIFPMFYLSFMNTNDDKEDHFYF